MITPGEALELVVRTAEQLPPQSVALSGAGGLVLAEDIRADRDYPPFARSMMDGFAVRLCDAGKTVPIAGEIPAGSVWKGEVRPGECLEILTGAPCPRGAEAVVPKEHIARHETFVDLPSAIKPGQYIAPQGSDCRRNDLILAAGQAITSMGIGALASFGRSSVLVTPTPRLAIITTGEELSPTESPLRLGQIRNSNGPMLAAMTRALGVLSLKQTHVSDRLEDTIQALEDFSDVDIVVLTGGVSVGTYDFVPQALASIGADVVFHGVKQKPGKPILFAHKRSQLFFGLPGNPLSCHFGFHRYVAAAIRKMSGLAAFRPVFQSRLADSFTCKGGRVHFLPGRAKWDGRSALGWQVEILPGASSADIFQGCLANCYVELPADARVYGAGEAVSFTWLGQEPWAD